MKRDQNDMGWLLLLLTWTMGLAGCSDDPVTGHPETETGLTVEVPVVFNLLPAGELTTKSGIGNEEGDGLAAAGVRLVFVDRVRLYVFKRKVGQYVDTESNFQLDTDNQNVILPCVKYQEYPYYRAQGSLNLNGGWEYRVNAIGYAEEKQEDTFFGSTGDFLPYFTWGLTKRSDEEYRTPEFFFGSFVQGTDTIFTCEKKEDSSIGTKAALEGWLRRGVAGIELRIGNVNTDPNAKTWVHKVELLADSIHTQVKGRSYDDFLNPFALVKDGTYRHYRIAVDSLRDSQRRFEQDSVRLMYANLLPVCSSLSLRITKKNDSGEETHEYCSLRVRQTGLVKPTTKTIPGHGGEEEGNGTGVIPGKPEYPDKPENPDEQVNPYRICFERNHYYRLKGDFNKLLLNEYILQVTVNPNWEGSINLPLDKQ